MTTCEKCGDAFDARHCGACAGSSMTPTLIDWAEVPEGHGVWFRLKGSNDQWLRGERVGDWCELDGTFYSPVAHEFARAEQHPYGTIENGVHLDVVRASYGWTLSVDGEVHGLIAGDQGYEPVGIKIDPSTDVACLKCDAEWLAAKHAETTPRIVGPSRLAKAEADLTRLREENESLKAQLAPMPQSQTDWRWSNLDDAKLIQVLSSLDRRCADGGLTISQSDLCAIFRTSHERLTRFRDGLATLEQEMLIPGTFVVKRTVAEQLAALRAGTTPPTQEPKP